MLYQSPLHIIKGIAGKDLDFTGSNLVRLRKQLIADLNLSGTTTITVNNKPYTKDEIIKTFDVLLNDPDLELHQFIFNTPALLTFLENNDALLKLHDYLKIEIPVALEEKVLLLVENRFILQLKKSLAKRNFVYATESILFVKQLKEERRELYYDAIHKSIVALANFNNAITEKIKEVSSKSFVTKGMCIKGNEFSFLGDPKLADLINILPEPLEYAIDAFVVSVINLMYHYHKQLTYDKKLNSRLSHMLIKIKRGDPGNLSIIVRNHEVYSATSNFSIRSGSLILFLIIVGIRIIGMAFFSSRSHTDFNYDDTRHKIFLKYNDKLSDSTYKFTPPAPASNEVLPRYPEMYDYIKQNLHYPEIAREKGTEGTVHISFIVEADGKVSNVKAKDSIGDGCGEEAIRVVKSMDHWVPGTKDGIPVRVQFNLPVKFTIK